MENRILKLENLKLARVKYFDEEHNGVEVTRHDAYAFLYDVDGEYINVLNPERELPVYGRVPYTNTTLDGEDFGSKIVLRSGEALSGPCYVIDYEHGDRFFERDNMTVGQLKQFVLKSSRFFIDRVKLIKEGSRKDRVKYSRKLKGDMKKLAEFEEYINSHEVNNFYR